MFLSNFQARTEYVSGSTGFDISINYGLIFSYTCLTHEWFRRVKLLKVVFKLGFACLLKGSILVVIRTAS